LETALHDLQREAAERQRAQAQLLEVALHDPLTGLPNRVYLLDWLAQALEGATRDPQQQFALLVLDCDRFKLINDSFGHSFGDELLLAIAQRLQRAFEPDSAIARLGGDEFAILLRDGADASQALRIVEQLQGLFATPFFLRQREVFVSITLGIVLGDRSYEQPEHLLRDADTAMYRAKAVQRGTYHIFDPALHAATLQALQLETDLRHALQHQELELYYQPIVELATGRMVGVEALARWPHPTRGFIPPARFIPIAEETGAIAALGEWALETACRQARAWQVAGVVAETFAISVNISACQLAHPRFLAQLDSILAETQLPPTCLKLEITESAIATNPQQAAAVMQALRDRQIQLSLDDFGTGYSSLSYLHLFPVDTLKIDRSFIQRLDSETDNLGLIEAILNIARSLGLGAIAEGIETAAHLKILRQLDCRLGQGFWFAEPLPAAAIAALCCQQPQW